MTEWRVYRRIGTVSARPYIEGETLPPFVSISESDRLNGSPRVGDMIARDKLTGQYDQWLINAGYFACHYDATPEPRNCPDAVSWCSGPDRRGDICNACLTTWTEEPLKPQIRTEAKP